MDELLDNKDINELGKMVKDIENNQKKILQILDSYNDKDIHYSRRFNIYDNEVMNVKEDFVDIKKVLTFQNQEIKELHEVVNKNVEDIDKIFGQISEMKLIVKEINDRELEKEEAMRKIWESDAKAMEDMNNDPNNPNKKWSENIEEGNNIG